MNYFQRTKREGLVLPIIGLTFLFAVSVSMLVVGGSLLSGGMIGPGIMLTLVGLPFFVILIRGIWMMTSGRLTHIFAIDENEMVWGFVGKEKSVPMGDVREIHWNVAEGFNFAIRTRSQGWIRLWYMDNVIPCKCQPKLLEFIRTVHPEIPINSSGGVPI